MQGFEKPHDLTVDPANNAVYVTEIGPNRIWKFVSINCEWRLAHVYKTFYSKLRVLFYFAHTYMQQVHRLMSQIYLTPNFPRQTPTSLHPTARKKALTMLILSTFTKDRYLLILLLRCPHLQRHHLMTRLLPMECCQTLH